MVKEQAWAQNHLQVINDTLDAVEGKKDVVELCSFVGVKYVDMTKTKERVKSIKEKLSADKIQQPNADKKQSGDKKTKKEKKETKKGKKK